MGRGGLALLAALSVAASVRAQAPDCFEQLRAVLANREWSEASPAGVHEELSLELAADADCAASNELGESLKKTASALLQGPRADPQQEWELLELASLGALLAGQADSAVYWRTRTAEFFRRQGRPTQSVAILEAALELHPDAANARAELLMALAESKRLIGESKAAWDLLDQAEQHLLEGPRWELVGASIPGLRAQVYLDLGLGDLARPWVERSMDIARDLRDRGPPYEGLLVAAQGRAVALEAATGNHGEALRLVDQYLGDEELYGRWRAEGAHLLLQRARSVLLLALHGEEALEVAERDLRALLAESRPDLGVLDQLDATLLLAKTLLARGDVARAQTVFEDRPKLPELPLKEGADLAVLAAHLALAEHADGERLEAAHAEVTAALDDLLAAWERAPERSGGVSFLRYAGRRSLLEAWIRLASERWGEEVGALRGLEKLVEVQRMGTLSRTASNAPAELSEIRTRLCGADRGVLVYFVAPERTHVYALDRGILVHEECPGRFAFESLQREWMLALDAARMESDSVTADLAEERALAARLSSILLPPSVQEIVAGWAGLSIVGTDLLDGVPIEWLPWRKGAHFGLDVAISFLPSLPLGSTLADEQRFAGPARELDLLLLAAPEVDPGVAESWPHLESLTLGDGFLDSLAKLYEGKRTSFSSGADASVAALDSPIVGNTGILHVIGHSLVDLGRERPVGLVLARTGNRSGLVWCEDVERLHAAELVMLTSCRSGAAPARRGDANAADMAGAWIAAGARAVLVTQRDLRLGFAQRLSLGLHRELVGGRSPCEALRRALNDLAREELPLRLPFLCGLPRIVGWGHVPLFAAHPDAEAEREAIHANAAGAPAPGSRWALVAALGGTLALVAIGALALRRRRPAWDSAERPRNHPDRGAE